VTSTTTDVDGTLLHFAKERNFCRVHVTMMKLQWDNDKLLSVPGTYTRENQCESRWVFNYPTTGTTESSC
jgi:hypothetical protein